MDIEIPSPSVFLRRTPSPPNVKSDTKEKVKVAPKEGKQQDNKDDRPTVVRRNTQERGVAKPKQSKSRNGCITCKKKRLKCDETKPSCAQCQKRGVECEGYKIAYKWRTFEELSNASRAGNAKNTKSSKAKKDAVQSQSQSQASVQAQQEKDAKGSVQERPSTADSAGIERKSPISPIAGVFSYPVRPSVPETPTSMGGTTVIEPSPLMKLGFGLDDMYSELDAHNFLDYNACTGRLNSPEHADEVEVGQHDDTNFFLDDTFQPMIAPDSNEQDDWLHNPALDLSIVMPHDIHDDDGTPTDTDFPYDGDERDILQGSSDPPKPTVMALTPRQRPRHLAPQNANNQELVFLKNPVLDLSTPEMLMLRFDRHTCGVLSVKDGMFENPWRTQIWPLAKDSEPLYHAILAMSALHGSGAGSEPQLRLTGVEHLQKSMETLASDIGRMSLEQALGTTLALTLAEAWDDKIKTGIHHLQGARYLLQRALETRNKNNNGQRNEAPLRFLANTYIYLEAIGRLTSVNQPGTIDLQYLLHATADSTDSDYEVDPLLGCGANLFPLLGQVAKLVHQIRGTRTNSLMVISEANEIKEQLLGWEPCDVTLFIPPEDPTSNVRHALHTAEAYRRATLLHLDQAIPELATESTYDQAKGILTALAAVPITSRTLVIQIFPLLVGSCEMTDIEDRQWVKSRWQAMMQRLTLINVSACWRVVREVWRRRDEWAQMSNRLAQTTSRDAISRPTSNASNNTFSRQQNSQSNRNRNKLAPMDTQIEYTVRGQLHWLGVMADWQWEVFL